MKLESAFKLCFDFRGNGKIKINLKINGFVPVFGRKKFII